MLGKAERREEETRVMGRGGSQRGGRKKGKDDSIRSVSLFFSSTAEQTHRMKQNEDETGK